MSLLLWCFGGFLMILGIVQLTEFILLFWNRPTWELARYLTVPLSGHVENMEQLIRYLRILTQWEDGRSEIFLLDIGMDDESREVCSLYCEQNEELHLVSAQQLAEYLLKKHPSK